MRAARAWILAAALCAHAPGAGAVSLQSGDLVALSTLGAGALYRIDPEARTGEPIPIAGGLTSPTGAVAVDGRGTIYVAEYDGARIRAIDAETGAVRVVTTFDPAAGRYLRYANGLALADDGSLLAVGTLSPTPTGYTNGAGIWRIDPSSGAQTLLAWSDLAFNGGAWSAYALVLDAEQRPVFAGIGAGAAGWEVFRLDPGSGAVSVLGDPAHNIAALELAPGGSVIASTYEPGAFVGHLVAVDPDTGAVTTVFSTSFPWRFGEGIRFLPDGRLAVSIGDTVEAVDLATGAREALFSVPIFAAAFAGLALVPVPEAGPAVLLTLGLAVLCRRRRPWRRS